MEMLVDSITVEIEASALLRRLGEVDRHDYGRYADRAAHRMRRLVLATDRERDPLVQGYGTNARTAECGMAKAKEREPARTNSALRAQHSARKIRTDTESRCIVYASG